jgi:peptidoglycan/LPS O-acetylase OafA/YrhL
MRALAVLAVLVFHLDPGLLPGGFTGVDVFFVLSGFLISSILFREWEQDRLDLAEFYQRRIARIFPVFFLVTLVTLGAAVLLYSPQDAASAGALAALSSLSLTNIKLMFQGNYFEISSDAQPFLHCWSLSVEEQFYLVFPPAILLARKLALTRRGFTFLLWGFTGISFLLCLYLSTRRPSWAFYLLPTRAWELLAGSLLALAAPAKVTRKGAWLGLTGLVFILAGMGFVRGGPLFPAPAGLLPVVGTVLAIRHACHPHHPVGRWLSLPPLVLIGKLSYSLYLWHWPVFCLVDYAWFDTGPLPRGVLKIGLTAVLAGVFYVLVEQPMRQRLNQPVNRGWSLGFLVAGVLLVIGLGFRVRSTHYINATLSSVAQGGLSFVQTGSAPTVVLMGDSHASTFGWTLRKIARDTSVNLHVISVTAEDPFPPTRLYQDSMAMLSSTRPVVVVFAANWTKKIGTDRGKLESMLADILRHGAHVILPTQPPMLPRLDMRSIIRQGGPTPIAEKLKDRTERTRANDLVKSMASDRVHVLDLESLFVDALGHIRFTDQAGRQLYHDSTHLSGHGTDLVRPELQKAMKTLIDR